MENVKMPWEVFPDEWENYIDEILEKGKEFEESPEHLNTMFYDQKDFDENPEMYQRAKEKIKEVFPYLFLIRILKRNGFNHEDLVRRAYHAGENIPEEVLNYYPHIKEEPPLLSVALFPEKDEKASLKIEEKFKDSKEIKEKILEVMKVIKEKENIEQPAVGFLIYQDLSYRLIKDKYNSDYPTLKQTLEDSIELLKKNQFETFQGIS